MTYEVTSDRVRGFDRGEIVTDTDLLGCNIVALVAAGHLTQHDTAPLVDETDGTEDETE